MSAKSIVILGAGVSGHTAAMFCKRYLGDKANITVISPEAQYNWIPSNIWVGVNRMESKDVLLPLAPVYHKQKISFIQAKATELYPEGKNGSKGGIVVCENTGKDKGLKSEIEYDFLINATGPKLNFAATPGLGPEGYSLSVCTASHAVEAAHKLSAVIEDMKKGQRKTLVVGMGHGTCTCEGAAFEYVFNVDTELRRAGVRDQAELIYITNEAELGDFGVDGIQLDVSGFITPSKLMVTTIYRKRTTVHWWFAKSQKHWKIIFEKVFAYLSSRSDGGESRTPFPLHVTSAGFF